MKRKLIRYVLAIVVSTGPLCSWGQNFSNLSFGSGQTLDLVTWNIEFFPKEGWTTINAVADAIEAMDAEVVAIQEIAEIPAFLQLMDRLPGYEGYYGSDNSLNLGFIVKKDVIQVQEVFEIYAVLFFPEFPRPPLVMRMLHNGQEYVVINNHYKCCGDNLIDLDDNFDEETRRLNASIRLEDYIRTFYPELPVVLLGDLNDRLNEPPGQNVFQPFFDRPAEYRFVDLEIDSGPSANWSYPSFPSHLDHILITDELFDAFEQQGSEVATIKLDQYFDGGFVEYNNEVSDHRPVGVKLDVNAATTSTTALEVQAALLSNWPNPFSGNTTFRFAPTAEVTQLRIFNSLGQVIARMDVAAHQEQLQWAPGKLATGLYSAQLITSDGQVLGTHQFVVSSK